MAFAVLSCVHANLEALEAVLAEIDALGIADVICLGDVVGLGASPIECTDLVRARCRVTLQGHCEEALVAATLNNWSSIHAKQTMEWTRALMSPAKDASPAAARRWAFLRDLPLRYREGDALFVHGSPRWPTNEHLQGRLLPHAGPTFEAAFSETSHLLFVGHTHVPELILDDLTARNAGHAFRSGVEDGGKRIVNVGSVGWSRDRDTRASYVTVDGEAVTWHRVAYPVEAAQEKMRRAGFAPSFIDRLAEGV